MHRSWKNRNETEGSNYWPAFADMAAATCMILVIFWIAGAVELGGSNDKIDELKQEILRLKDLVGKESELAERIRKLEKELAQEKATTTRLFSELEQSEKIRRAQQRQLEELQKKVPHDEPPNIVLAQDESFVFPSLQATVPPDFATRFKLEKRKAVINALNSASNVEVIEIIGHTDNVQVGGNSNVDINLEDVFAGIKSVDSLQFGSNCELGLARAIAVKAMLNDFLQSLGAEDGLTDEGMKRVSKLTYRTYSAAQLFPVDSAKTGQEADRRIEIRFTRLRSDQDPDSP